MSRTALAEMVTAKTGFTVTADEIANYLPTWPYVYRRTDAISVDNLVKFRKEVKPLAEWQRIGENGDVVV